MINVFFAAKPERWVEYETALKDALKAAGLTANLRTDFAPEEVDYIVYAPNSAVQDFTPYTRCKDGAEPLGWCREHVGTKP